MSVSEDGFDNPYAEGLICAAKLAESCDFSHADELSGRKAADVMKRLIVLRLKMATGRYDVCEKCGSLIEDVCPECPK